ncbi:MAG: proline--tRNA ligase [Bacteroidota bacterium]
MRFSSGFIPTVKETPADAQLPSHQLMIRAGMVRALAAGVYLFLPLGYRIIKKITEIVREEMEAIGGQELHLPALSPIELWEETGRVKAFGDTLFHIKNRPLVLAPTHEEIVCWLSKNHVKSYRDLPQIWYQIQTKFRNEPRPRSGVIRGRQFLMKDSYSLDATREGLDRSYDLHAQAYNNIFSRCGLKFFVVGASSGAMGGTGSQEFMIESEGGEDVLALSEDRQYAANLEVATSQVPNAERFAEVRPLEEVHTPDVRTINELSDFLHVDEKYLAKSVVYWAGERPVLCLMMGNDELNEAKLSAVMRDEVRPVESGQLRELTGADGGSIGPVGINDRRTGAGRITVIADRRLEGANYLVSGANKNDYHYRNVDLTRDCIIDGYHDLRSVRAGEKSPRGDSALRIVRGIELGHIFKLGTKYSDALHSEFLDEQGKAHPVIMGSYGIGIERIMACFIEQNHDDDGIMWNAALAPFAVHLLAATSRSETVTDSAEGLYHEVRHAGIETLFDDRTDISPGSKFKDADLLGIPLQVIVGERNLNAGNVEIKIRRTGERKIVRRETFIDSLRKLLASLD